MPQPLKKHIVVTTIPKKKRIRNASDGRIPPKKNVPVKGAWKKERKHPEYGTSKLEGRFAKKFLDKLGVKYIAQYKAESIGRYYDFCIPSANLLIEIDGDYYHSYGLVYEEMSPMQKHNKRVDEQKDHWAYINSFKLLRIWEHDINEHPEKVMEILKQELNIGLEKENKRKIKNRRH